MHRQKKTHFPSCLWSIVAELTELPELTDLSELTELAEPRELTKLIRFTKLTKLNFASLVIYENNFELCGEATHEQPSCVMSDRRLNLVKNLAGFALIPYNPCTS